MSVATTQAQRSFDVPERRNRTRCSTGAPQRRIGREAVNPRHLQLAPFTPGCEVGVLDLKAAIRIKLIDSDRGISLMKVISTAIGALFVGLFASTAITLAFRSIDSFAQFMPPAALYGGAVLLLIAFMIGFVRRQYLGLIAVGVWVLGTGLMLFMGQSSTETLGDPFTDVARKAIPWTFIASCACAILLNSTI
ncbi:hypothetical protein [Burkholderia sp. BE17]|uniref:hypothetical protein n=1 Tax=Burkholderia sp. BE17 TaxID=2656644 RepID=UPI00128BD6AF|nr:hypothetical protein [Burkholderia sp. BE17]MPV65547.1 hypothetical protein [Burkholderia sp. BE17]